MYWHCTFVSECVVVALNSQVLHAYTQICTSHVGVHMLLLGYRGGSPTAV